MKQKVKYIVSISFIFLLLIQDSHQALTQLKHKVSLGLTSKNKNQSIKINDPELSNSDDAIVPNPKFDISEARGARTSRELVRQILGESNWEKIQKCIF